MSKKRVLKIYQAPSGKEPFIDWLESLKDRKTRSRILTRLDRLEVGNPGDHKHLKEQMFELRLDFGSGYRIYYGQDGDVVVLLLMGGDKSSKKKILSKLSLFGKIIRRPANEKF